MYLKTLNYHINKCLFVESSTSDQYEAAVASTITSYFKAKKIKGKAVKSGGGTQYSDVFIDTPDAKAWVEVKMNHTDNLYNKRLQIVNGKWQPMSDNLIGNKISAALNNDNAAKTWIKNLAKFLNKKPNEVNLRSIAKLKTFDDNTVSPKQLAEFLKSNPRNITTLTELDVKRTVIDHYTAGGKAANVSYLQSGDDFYQFKRSINPIGFKDLPSLDSLKVVQLDPVVRISLRSEGYEILPTFKFKSIPSSKYSFMPGSIKPMPSI